MQRDHVNWTTEDGVATLVISNGPLNVLSSSVKRELSACLDEVSDDLSVRVVIVTGAGNRAFMAGGDIKEFTRTLEEGTANLLRLFDREAFNKLACFSKPTIAAVNGLAYGGGTEVALLCDLRIAGADVKFCLPEINIGLFPAGGGTQRLPRLVGKAKAKEMMFFGEPITAEEALRIGLINRVTPPGQALVEARQWAGSLAKRSGVVLRAIKKVIDEGYDVELDSGLDLELQTFAEILESADAREGMLAFIEKRKAIYTHS